MIPQEKRGEGLAGDVRSRIETELEVKSYIQNLKFALNNGAQIAFQARRLVMETQQLLLCLFILLKRLLLQKCFHIGRIRRCFHEHEDYKK